MTSKSFSVFAVAIAMIFSLSACSLDYAADENLVQVQISEASYHNLYGGLANTCDNVAGDACN